MKRTLNIETDEKIKKQSVTFKKKLESTVDFTSVLANDTISFDWLDEVELACPYIDNIVRNPRMALITEEDVVNIDKAKKVTVESVKHLAKNTQFIDKIDAITDDVQPSRILITRREETHNTYENRYIYTLITDLIRFVYKQESLLDDFEMKNEKKLNYEATTVTSGEKININVNLTAQEMPGVTNEKNIKKELNKIRKRIKFINDYIGSWQRSEFMESLEKARVPFVIPPIRKTNLILKNPNFQYANRLWDYLRRYSELDKGIEKEDNNTFIDELLKGMLDDAFMTNYFVLSSISSSRKERKELLSKYAVIMVTEQIKRVISILLNNGVKVTKKEIMDLIFKEIGNERTKVTTGGSEVKKKFKDTIDEYLERRQKYL